MGERRERGREGMVDRLRDVKGNKSMIMDLSRDLNGSRRLRLLKNIKK